MPFARQIFNELVMQLTCKVGEIVKFWREQFPVHFQQIHLALQLILSVCSWEEGAEIAIKIRHRYAHYVDLNATTTTTVFLPEACVQ